jgi:hypothetical protein
MRTVQPMGSHMSISAQVTHASATEEISTMIRHMFHVKHRVAHRAEASGFDAPIAPRSFASDCRLGQVLSILDGKAAWTRPSGLPLSSSQSSETAFVA